MATPPQSPASAERAGFIWSSSFGLPGRDNYREAYRHADGRMAWFHWPTPISSPIATETP